MSLSKTRLGPFTLYSIEAGRIRLDGGAMFGVVPKTLWSRQIEADEKNRIQMTMRCLLITSEETGRVYLVDNGAGAKFSKKLENIYQLDYRQADLNDSLSKQGFEPEQVTDLIFTHLHFDHCGGTTRFSKEGELIHTFPNARYHVTLTHWETATHPNSRERASFLKENIEPIGEWENLHLVEDNHTWEKGFSSIVVNGHTTGQQLPLISGGGKTVLFAADLIPTAAHVPIPWIMGYDMRPIETLREKEEILNRAADKGWYLFLEHDVENEVITLSGENGRIGPGKRLTLKEI